MNIQKVFDVFLEFEQLLQVWAHAVESGMITGSKYFINAVQIILKGSGGVDGRQCAFHPLIRNRSMGIASSGVDHNLDTASPQKVQYALAFSMR